MAFDAEMFPKLDHKSSKEEEISYINSLRAAVGDQTYMASLLSEPLIEYFQARVKDDVSVDIFLELTLCRKEGTRIAEELREAQASLMTAQIEKRDLQEQLDTERAYARQLKDQLESVDEALHDAVSSMLEAQNKVQYLEMMLANRDAVVKDLKIRIFDMENPDLH